MQYNRASRKSGIGIGIRVQACYSNTSRSIVLFIARYSPTHSAIPPIQTINATTAAITVSAPASDISVCSSVSLGHPLWDPPLNVIWRAISSFHEFLSSVFLRVAFFHHVVVSVRQARFAHTASRMRLVVVAHCSRVCVSSSCASSTSSARRYSSASAPT